jgi:hypothetical protein
MQELNFGREAACLTVSSAPPGHCLDDSHGQRGAHVMRRLLLHA